MEFKDNLKKLRTEKGLTQAQLAEKLFVSRSNLRLALDFLLSVIQQVCMHKTYR